MTKSGSEGFGLTRKFFGGRVNKWARASALAAFLATSLAFGQDALAACPNGVVETGETCDDGNATSGDGCSNSCQYEAGYVCTGAPSLCCFSDATSGFTLTNNASANATTGEITLTPNLNAQKGYAWFRSRLDFSTAFAVDLKLYLGNDDAGADGGSIMFQRDSRGAAANGGSGGELGATGIDPLIAVEFDTYNNDSGYGDIAADHTSIFFGSPGGAVSGEGQITGTACMNAGCSNYEDGVYHNFKVSWNPTTTTMTVTIDGAVRITLVRNLVHDFFADNPANIMFGFAASTGGAKNLQKFCPKAPAGYTIPADEDGDGVDSKSDQDDDNDGISDATETFGAFGGADPGNDHDTDGIANWEDPDYWNSTGQASECPDALPPIGKCDTLPLSVDYDADGIPNHLDTDSDGDGVKDTVEAGYTDANNDGKPDNCGTVNSTTGICASGVITGPANSDTGSDNPDTWPDFVDGDDDGDGVPTISECSGQSPCLDTDGDGIPDNRDSDSDNDGVPDNIDASRTGACSPATTPASCTTGDTDGDGIRNGIECARSWDCDDSDGDGTPDYLDTDSDNDGTSDQTECPVSTSCTDTDSDSIPNYRESNLFDTDGDGNTDDRDNDADGDGILDSVECSTRPCPDTDGDGIFNYLDKSSAGPGSGDSDNDGVADSAECPTGLVCVDTDGDKKPDYTDPDSDNDGLNDGVDSDPLDPCLPVEAAACDAGDPDNDGIPNVDECSDELNCEDTDNDGTPDYLDTDSDNDGEDDDTDVTTLDPCVPATTPAACTTGDTDADGLTNGTECSNPLSCPDSDADGTLDYLDTDSDNDGNPDTSDGSPVNPCQPSSAAAACASGDTDADGLTNSAECGNALNCPDTDSDGTPDFQDTDSDNDGTPDSSDSAVRNPCLPETAAAACASGDSDGDGLTNGTECSNPLSCPDTDGDGTPDFQDTDADNDGETDATDGNTLNPCSPSPSAASCPSGDTDADGITNGTECSTPLSCQDTDGDGTPDYRDTDSDNDGTPDSTETDAVDPCLPATTPAACGTGDADNDGRINSIECSDDFNCEDTDNDGTPDFQDTDSDNDGENDADDTDVLMPCAPSVNAAACTTGDTDGDGITNGNECSNPLSCEDTDGDGTPDFKDRDSDNDGEDDAEDSSVLDSCTPSADAAACTTGDTDGDGLTNGEECSDALSCEDTDNDGTPDFKDTDSDNDGTNDDTDTSGLDPCAPSNLAAACTTGDTDNDGLTNVAECSNPLSCPDSDNDGTPDFQDTDSDNDGEVDTSDQLPHNPCAPLGTAAACTTGDTDGDGITNLNECGNALNCPDSDNDGTPDFQDTDSDNDGVNDDTDTAIHDACVPSTNAAACASGDADSDGITNGTECSDALNCADTDDDGTPDFQDTDSDNDGEADITDQTPKNPCLPSTNAAACTTGDTDADGITNGEECTDALNCDDTDADGTPDFQDTDSDNDGEADITDQASQNPCAPLATAAACTTGDTDGDGITNHDECGDALDCPDSDGDGTPDFRDTDSDNDDTPDVSDASPLNPCAPSTAAAACTTGDTDGDGIANSIECSNALSCPDTDHDGIPDFQDTDSDNDGQSDDTDEHPKDACAPSTIAAACATGDADGDGLTNAAECSNPLSCTDSDNDGIPDFQDTDSDNDDELDATDQQPGNPCTPVVTAAACTTGDTDGDGISNHDECGSALDCPDSDGDGTPDFRDTDSDNDGTEDNADNAPLDACLPSTAAATCTSGDADGDGISNGEECSDVTECTDTDADGIPDFEDSDSDNDGVDDDKDQVTDNPCIPSTAAAACATGDADGDGITNSAECSDITACPDSDDDGIPDFQDIDSDNDGLSDDSDQVTGDPCVPSTAAAACATGDADGDGISNADECSDIDACKDTDGDGIPDFQDSDSDNDGITDGEDPTSSDPCVPDANSLGCAAGDADGDGIANQDDPSPSDECKPNASKESCQPSVEVPTAQPSMPAPADDSDNDGISDADECGNKACPDTDNDGQPDSSDDDDDNDGLTSAREAEDEKTFGSDVDGDGIPNHLDTDSDNDGILDRYESNDSNGDGTPDYLQSDRVSVRGGTCNINSGNPTGNSQAWLGLLMALAGVARIRSGGRRKSDSDPTHKGA